MDHHRFLLTFACCCAWAPRAARGGSPCYRGWGPAGGGTL